MSVKYYKGIADHFHSLDKKCFTCLEREITTLKATLRKAREFTETYADHRHWCQSTVDGMDDNCGCDYVEKRHTILQDIDRVTE